MWPAFAFKAAFALGALAHSFSGSFAGRSLEASWRRCHSAKSIKLLLYKYSLWKTSFWLVNHSIQGSNICYKFEFKLYQYIPLRKNNPLKCTKQSVWQKDEHCNNGRSTLIRHNNLHNCVYIWDTRCDCCFSSLTWDMTVGFLSGRSSANVELS